MNILVVNPPNKPFTNASILAEPIDVLQIATVIKKNYHDVKVIDMDVNRINNNINDYLDNDNVVVFIYDYQLPLHTSAAVDNIFETIKNTNKPTKFIIIGKTPSYYYEKFLNNGFDVVISGVAENIINDVIKNINDIDNLKQINNLFIKGNNQIIITDKQKSNSSFADLPIPDRSLVDLNKYMDTRTIVTSRGCNGHCNYCSTPSHFGGWQGKSANVIFDEINMLVNDYGAKKIMFLDDNATVSKERIIELCNKLNNHHTKVLLGLLCSIKCYDKEMFELMYKVGFRWVHFGIESGSLEILKKMNKEMNINYIKKVIKEVKAMGYRVRNSFILDYPSTTVDDVKKTKELILALKPQELRLHYLAYRVGTPIFNKNDNTNQTQYIHNSKPNYSNKEIDTAINDLMNILKDNNYEIVDNDVNWNMYQDTNKNVASLIPMKYGLNWY